MEILNVVSVNTKTVLLISSEQNLRDVLEACLIDLAGWQVLTAEDLLAGLGQAALDQPDAIILVMSKFGRDGFMFLQQLRKNTLTQEIPIVIMISGSKWMDMELFEKYRVTGIIDYEIDPVILPHQVANLLGWEDRYRLN
ncbi:MAG TPA: response regulator [Cyanobacteria bacterium UBA11149]|nr:response regulator [Cyanobacteria bacterium UBA11367]HBE58706.1 response regulator [Cyanobacteria bacterium UBA11366]HBK66210.1 response regulator [Cyanobacteria bacterium UBA11166]HBR74763.1 response regulator [Cyanobacteria bacterium UBA11159]HBS72303.1 response regulator [Cyanobacteria bacterium UBA11153]HBW90491.1 response regulator [Cyanobacteria bacterium UBA11149]HCA93882.1 response regulator [Cyanobacteria bacterium UBA9226]